jgi:ssDNA-binding Zn-finger/Zn-ribbon topoisomerase 1
MPIEDTKCPECDGPMISRHTSTGVFWGCKDYPKCKGTRDSMGRSKADREEEKSKDVKHHR